MDADVVFIDVILVATSASNMPPSTPFVTSDFSVTGLTVGTTLKMILKKSRTDLGAKSV